MSGATGGLSDEGQGTTNRWSEGDIQLQIGYLLADIRESLGELRNAVKVSDDARKITDERILQLVERATTAETILANVDKTVDRHRADIDGLGARHNKDLSDLKNELNQLGRRLENKINDVGTGLTNSISDLRINEIGKLNSFADTTKSYGQSALTLLGGGCLLELARLLITHHW